MGVLAYKEVLTLPDDGPAEYLSGYWEETDRKSVV